MDVTWKFIIFIGITCLSQFVNPTDKLNVPRVLLPVFKNTFVNFTLEVSGTGCYRWSTSRPDLILVTGIYENGLDNCSKEASIKVLFKEMTKKTVMVIAEDIKNGISLRADVIIDVISSLKIITKSRELYMEEPPQMFEVRAYDSKGNEFTTLEGVEFQWRITSSSVAGAGDTGAAVIALIAFRDSPYEPPSSVALFDSIGKLGHIVLVEGIKTGSAKIFVQLPHQEYNFVEHASVKVVVVPNLILEPSTVYILPETTVDFRLFQIRLGKKVEIDFGNRQFELISGDENVAIVKQMTATGLALGKVEVTVHDNSIPDQSTIKLPSALLAVIEPYYMVLSILPYNSWTLTVNQKATIVPEVYGFDNEKIWISPRMYHYTTVAEDIFQLNSEHKNGTLTGVTYQRGYGRFIIELENYKHISAKKTLIVYPSVTISPKILALPWVPDYTSRLKGYLLKASGGDGNFVWSSENSTVADILQNGRISLNALGSTTVSVQMRENRYSEASARIHLLPPDELTIFNNLTESVVGDDIYLHLSLYGTIRNATTSEKVPFSNCSFLNFEVITNYPFINSSQAVDIKPQEGACAVKRISSRAVGFGKVIVTLDINGKKLYADTLVSAHSPLISLQPAKNEHIVLALGSSYDIVFTGGPQPYFGGINTHVSYTESYFHVEEIITKRDPYVFRVTCLKIGIGSLALKVVTYPLDFSGIEVEGVVSISCKIPKSFEIHSKSKTSCSEIFPQRFITYPLSKVRFDVKLYDDAKIEFTNATSILFHWKFNNDAIARFDQEKMIKLEEKDNIDFKTAISHYITASINYNLGDVKAEGIMLGYDESIVSSLHLDKSKQFPSDLISFTLSVVQKPTVEPIFLSIFNHPKNTVQLKVKGGSGHFSFEKTNDVISVNYNYKTRAAEICPLSDGSGEITVIDKCLPDISPPKIEFQVVSITSLTLSSSSKVQEGHLLKVTIHLLDSDERPFAIPAIEFSTLGIQLKSYNPSIASFDETEKPHLDHTKGTIDFILKGIKQGETTIRGRWRDIFSNSITIQVFPRLKISPRSITLTVGSEIQLKYTGGPSSDAHVSLTVSDPTIVSVTTSSIAKGIKPGETSVTAQSLGHQDEVYSEDTIDVRVLPLTGVHIVAPTTKLGLGNVMPVYASGIPHHISPMLLGSITPSLMFNWHVSLPNVVHIKDTLYNTNIQVTDENKLSIRVFGANPGKTVLHLTVTGLHSHKINFNSSIEITVFNHLKWTIPNIESNYMLMAPNTIYHLRTNSIEKDFRSIQSTDVWSSNSEKPLLKVSADGLIQSGSNYGLAVVYVKTYGFDSTLRDIALVVQIKPVHYLMINSDTVLETSEDVKSLPRGLFLNITISYHDENGYEFFVPPNTKPIVECNVCSKIHIEYSGSNHSIITSLASSGHVILQIHDFVTETKMEDYIKILVENYIVPGKKYLTVGEIICYWTPLITQKGVWTTDNSVDMYISEHGMARADRVGSASVYYSSFYPEPVLLASLSVEILPLQSFLIGHDAPRSITNAVGSTYLIPVFLINEKQKNEPTYSKYCKDLDFIKLLMPFTCDLYYTSASRFYPVDRVFSVHAEFNNTLGCFTCVITAIKGASKDTSIIESNLTLSVTGRIHRSIYETFFLNFHPQFFVNVDHLTFTQHETIFYITVTGTPDVLNDIFVESTGRKEIIIGRPFRESDRSFIIVVQSNIPENQLAIKRGELYVLISSHITNQIEKIPVTFKFEEGVFFPIAVLGAFLTFLKGLLILFTLLFTMTLEGLCCTNLFFALIVYGILGASVAYYFLRPDEVRRIVNLRKRSAYGHTWRYLSPLNSDMSYAIDSDRSPSSYENRPLMASRQFLQSTHDRLPSESGVSSDSSSEQFSRVNTPADQLPSTSAFPYVERSNGFTYGFKAHRRLQRVLNSEDDSFIDS